MIYIGTSGYSYQDWIGPFYPENTQKGEMLSLYAEEFNFTEINSTYYQMPNPFMMKHLVEKTPESFTFSVKAHQTMTHTRDAGKKEYDDFKKALTPLREVGKLSGVLLQFPYSFHFTNENMKYLEKIKEGLGDYTIAVEFRNSNWLSQATFDLLKKLDLSYVSVDEPNIKGLLEPAAVATNTVGYIRFHGRNEAKWYHHSSSYERYDYLYKDEELKEWVPKIKSLEKRTTKLYIAFNNHFKAQGVLNGRMLNNLLAISG